MVSSNVSDLTLRLPWIESIQEAPRLAFNLGAGASDWSSSLLDLGAQGQTAACLRMTHVICQMSSLTAGVFWGLLSRVQTDYETPLDHQLFI